MATVTPRTARTIEQAHTRIRSPLDRLRKYITSYVSAEGAAVFGLFVALWFWIGLLIDYGFFKAFTFDWVQELPWWFRFGVLVGLTSALLALVATKVLTGLLKRFSDAAVALVLERRFPDLLGDRLITAVELADPEEAARLGYSADLVRQTIHEAAERVDRVPVKEVFDWRRLVRRGLVVAVLTLGLYLLVGGSFAATRGVWGDGDAAAGFGDFNEVSSIWVERNILLRNTIWPRRAYLEIVGFPDDLRIAKETSPPTLRVRAWKYVFADPAAAEGWRLLTWQDLKDRDDLADGPVPEPPADWKPRDPEAGLTVDEVELHLGAFDVRRKGEGQEELKAKWNIASLAEESGYRPLQWSDLTKERLGGLNVPALPPDWLAQNLPAAAAGGAGLGKVPFGAVGRLLAAAKQPVSLSIDAVEKQLEKAEKELKSFPPAQREGRGKGLADIRAVFSRLTRLAELREALDSVDARAAKRSMSRTMRKLIVPESVVLTFTSRISTNQNTLTRVADNEYTGTFGELKDTVTFTVRGEDYITPRRTITVVDLPRLEKLESEEERPAYIYYRSEEGKAAALRGLRQPFQAINQSVSGDTTTMDIPAGTHLSLTATTNKSLRSVKIVPLTRADARVLAVSHPELVEENSFRCTLKDVHREQRFTFEFTDTDGVLGRRNVVIVPRADTAPRVREFNPDDVIRRAKEGYIVGVGARLPFKGKVRDDNGLARVRYACTVVPSDFISEQKLRALDGVAAVPLLAPGTGTRLLAVGAMLKVFRDMAQAPGEERPEEQLLDIPAFAQVVEQNRLQDGRSERLDPATMRTLLGEKQRDPFRRLFREFSLEPDKWTENDPEPTNPSRWVKAQDTRAPIGFDLPFWQLTYKGKKLKDPDDTKTQKRYLVEVRLLADDTYTEGEVDKATGQPRPNTTPSGETFTFVIVPENELLSAIAGEEDVRYRELENAFKPIAASQDRLRDVFFGLQGNPSANDLGSYLARTDQIDDVLKVSQQDVKAVSAAYDRIVREMRVNQVREDMQRRVYNTISRPLAQAADTNFERTRSAMLALRKTLDDKTASVAARGKAAQDRAGAARKELRALVEKLNGVLTAMQGLAKINDLINALAEIEKKEGDLEALLRKIRRIAIEKLLKDPDEKKE